ncbi:MAG: endolytic transglycosylase MltG, partial [Sulfurovum sp.]|nr:endolytic transglycosylase MltG [Sulfurovum sp.]
IARKADENATMRYIFLNSRRKLNKFVRDHFKYTPELMELKIAHVIASIIQKESNSIHEMLLISSVIYNRLEKGMRLQIDSTLNYGPYAHTIVTPERIKSDESDYNTYKHKGLPPHPLSTVTLDALRASINPTTSNYIFFMLNQDGTHNFTATYRDHLQNIRAFRAYQKERNKKKQEANNTYGNLSSRYEG